MIALGDAFWALNPKSRNPPHLYFVISDPSRNGGHTLLVNMTERRAGSDDSCRLQPGEHPCVKKDSVIHYAEMIFPDRFTPYLSQLDEEELAIFASVEDCCSRVTALHDPVDPLIPSAQVVGGGSCAH